MNASLIQRWNSRVDPDDLVYVVGDFAMGPEANVESVRAILRQLNGAKNFIFGNHDQVTKYGPGLWPSLAEDDGVLEDMHTETIDGQEFVMCHYPQVDWNRKAQGAILLHGHVHTQFSLEKRNEMIAARRYDIGVDMYGGPVQITGDLRYLNDPKGWA